MADDTDDYRGFSDALKSNGGVPIHALIENLQRFPQSADVRIVRNTIYVKFFDELYCLDDNVPNWGTIRDIHDENEQIESMKRLDPECPLSYPEPS